MQGHKKLIPELKLNDNLRKLRGGVTPTPTPTPTDSNVKFYKLDVTVEYNPLIKQYEAQSSDPTLYNQINADYQQYGDDALYCIDVQVTDDEDNTFNIFLFLRNNNDGKYVVTLSYGDSNVSLTLVNNGFHFIYWINEDYSHTNVCIKNGSLKVYDDINEEDVFDDDAAAYLINQIITIYGTDTKLLFTNDTEDGFCTLNNVSHTIIDDKLVYVVSGYKGDKPISLLLTKDSRTLEYSWYLNGGSVEWNITEGDMNVYDRGTAVPSSEFYNLLNLITTSSIQSIKFNLHVDIIANLTNYVKHPITLTEWSLQNNSSVDCMTSTVYVAALDKHITIFIPIEDNPASYVYYQVV